MIRTTTKYTWAAMTVLLLAGLAPAAHASSIATLQDWCGNINGVNVSTNFCNQAPAAVSTPADVNDSSFDFTLGGSATPEATNNLGPISITLTAGNNQYVLMYMDYDLNFNAVGGGSYNDYASTGGALASGESYELDDPNTSNIFNDFAANTLANTNNVGTPQSPGVCCDVSWALGLNLNVAANTTDVVTFTVSATAPASGFYLQQTNSLDSQSIYMNATVQVNQLAVSGAPEPSSWLLIAAGLAGAFLARRKMANVQNDRA